MTWSDYIDELEKLILDTGILCVNRFAIHLPSDSEKYISGRIDYRRGVIELNEPKAKQALFTLAHEGGHWNSFVQWANRIPQRWLPYKLQVLVWDHFTSGHEELADIEGWKLLERLGAPEAMGFTYKDYSESRYGGAK
jgi:hypothetical protein